VSDTGEKRTQIVNFMTARIPVRKQPPAANVTSRGRKLRAADRDPVGDQKKIDASARRVSRRDDVDPKRHGGTWRRVRMHAFVRARLTILIDRQRFL
jgi:hypothetical protein